MKINKFRIQKYKNIEDSGWVKLVELTVLMGKNESGKTTLLQALHKFNPYTPDPYNIDREWPRGQRRKRNKDQIVASLEFELSPDELNDLASIIGSKLADNHVMVTRNYCGQFEVKFADGIFPEKLHSNDIDKICELLEDPTLPVGEQFVTVAKECKEEIRRLAYEGRFSEFTRLQKEHKQMLEAVRAIGDPQPQHQHETQIIASYSAFLTEICEKLAAQPSFQRDAHEFIVERIPPFIYMDEFKAFTGTALLDQVQQRYKNKTLTEEDETLLMIMNLSGLDLDEEVKKSNSEDCKQRQYDLDDASMALSRRIEGHWRQRKYDVQFRGDGQYFYTMVKDERPGSGLIPLEERSKGFQWFFSFDLLLMHESEGTFENCIILLDEPGLHLHSEAQQDLLQRLEIYAQGNTLIYTTHLPFMLNLEKPERIRIISERADGTAFVSEDLSLSTAGEKLTLQSALCMQGSNSQNVAQKNLVVGGVDNYLIISALSDLIWRSGKEGIPDDIFLTAGPDARGAIYLSTLMIGQARDVLTIFDANCEGRAAEEQLREKWLSFYKGVKAKSILLCQLAGLNRDVDFAIENLFTDNFYLQKVNEIYGDQIKAAGVNLLTLKDEGLLCDRVEQALLDCGIERFERSLVAKRIRSAIVSMKSTGELPKETRDKAEHLIMEIVKSFPNVSES